MKGDKGKPLSEGGIAPSAPVTGRALRRHKPSLAALRAWSNLDNVDNVQMCPYGARVAAANRQRGKAQRQA